MSNEDVAKFIRERLIKQKEHKYTRYTSNNDSEFDEEPRSKPQNDGEYDLGAICEDILDHCVKTLDSKDNCSVIIVLFE
jgi:hypothetical protein